MLSENKMLMINLFEEATETALEASKCIKYTAKARASISNPEKTKNHGLNLVVEFTQLSALVEELQSRGVLPTLSVEQSEQIKSAKLKRALENAVQYQDDY